MAAASRNAFTHLWIVVLVLVCTVALTNGQLERMTLTHAASLDADQRMHLGWAFNSSHIVVELTARTRGWMAFAISPNGGMHESDVMLAWVDDRTGQPTVQDRWNTMPGGNNVVLLMDSQQDWALVSGTQNTTHTVVRAIRRLQTCDAQDRPFTGDTLRIIYAMHTSDPASPNEIVRHSFRGGRSMLVINDAFRTGASALARSDRSLRTIDLLVDKVTVPADTRTMYWCAAIKLPRVDRKHHVVTIKPTITKGNEDVVHHVLVYICNDKISDSFPRKAFECTFNDIPNPTRDALMSNCTKMLGVFGIGSDPFYFPAEAGLPYTPDMGGKYVFIEMHYDNPESRPILDSSGISLDITPNLRPNDAGIVMMGSADLSPSMMIPPNLDNFVFTSRCSADCMTQNMPRDGINIISVFLHSHMIGKKLVMRHIRNGREFAPIAKDDTYDFNYQEAQRISPPKKLLPGDEVQVDCHFSSQSRDRITFGGWGSPEEMCMAFVTYYPATEVAQCASHFFLGSAMKAAHIIPQDMEISSRESPPDMEMVQNILREFDWSQQSVKDLENYYRTGKFYGVCLVSGEASRKELRMNVTEKEPKKFQPYVENPACGRPGIATSRLGSASASPISQANPMDALMGVLGSDNGEFRLNLGALEPMMNAVMAFFNNLMQSFQNIAVGLPTQK